jgi:hypothetical protein
MGRLTCSPPSPLIGRLLTSAFVNRVTRALESRPDQTPTISLRIAQPAFSFLNLLACAITKAPDVLFRLDLVVNHLAYTRGRGSQFFDPYTWACDGFDGSPVGFEESLKGLVDRVVEFAQKEVEACGYYTSRC